MRIAPPNNSGSVAAKSPLESLISGNSDIGTQQTGCTRAACEIKKPAAEQDSQKYGLFVAKRAAPAP